MEMLQFSLLSNDCNISHFITTRHGGVGQGPYASFNLSAYCGDDPNTVQENRRRLCENLKISMADLYVPFQIHESDIAVLDDAFLTASISEKARALHGKDGLVTNIRGICLAVTTADCVPLLFYAPDKQVVGVAHAGWRGTARNIAGIMVRMLVDCYAVAPANLRVGIAPSIGKEAFEVGDEVVVALQDSGVATTFICSYDPLTGKAHVDLPETNRLQLLDAGVLSENIEKSEICTFKRCDDFFSARRLGLKSGRFLSGIMLV